MNLLTNWIFWVVVYLISAVLFAQLFKHTNRTMKNPALLTILLEGLTALSSLIFIFLFPLKISTNIITYIILFAVTIIYAIVDRLNIEARYGLEPSNFSMLKQLSSVFIIIFGIIFLKEKIVLNKILGASIIIFANILLTFNKGKLHINKYFIMSIFANFLFAIAMIINVNISNEFNIALYTFITTFIPCIILLVFNKFKLKDLKNEFNLYDKKKFILVAMFWSLMLISSVKAYEFGNVVIVATFLTLTAILNAVVELFFDKDRKKFLKKLLIGILIVIGIILIKK